MKTFESQSPYQARARRSTLKLFLWVGIWVASFAIATFGPKFIWDEANRGSRGRGNRCRRQRSTVDP